MFVTATTHPHSITAPSSSSSHITETPVSSSLSPQGGTDWVLQLPDELQIKIISHLPSLERILAATVCQKWKRLAFDGTLWACIDVSPFYRSIPADQLLRLGMAGGKYLKVANFRMYPADRHGLRTLSDHCPNVSDLNLKDCRSLSTHSIACFLQTAKNLRTLNLSGLDTVTNSTLQLVSQLTTLQKVDISWCRNVTGQGVQAVGAHCHGLSSLKLNGCPQLDEAVMGILGRNLSKLTHLSLGSCVALTDSALLAFLAHQSHHGAPLTHLNLSGCARLTDASLRHIALHCISSEGQQQHLTHLELTGCALLTDQGFSYLAPRLRTLAHLDLEDLPQITGITVMALANNEPNLRRLCLSNCTQISDDAIVHLVLHGASRCIEHLELDNCTVTDHALEMISAYLKDQQLQQNKPTSPDSGLDLVIPHDSVQRSLYMEVLDCSSISEDGVKSAIAKAGSLLTIKSFYSWQDQNTRMSREDNDADDDDEYHNNIGMVRSRRARRAAAAVSAATTARRRYNTIGFHRRRPESAGPPYASNCIIL